MKSREQILQAAYNSGFEKAALPVTRAALAPLIRSGTDVARRALSEYGRRGGSSPAAKITRQAKKLVGSGGSPDMLEFMKTLLRKMPAHLNQDSVRHVSKGLDKLSWVGVDLDGTLARQTGDKPSDGIGPPLQPLVNQIREMLRDGRDVRIMTDRVSKDSGKARRDVKKWCEEHLGESVPITNRKDADMDVLIDDAAVPVDTNSGEIKQAYLRGFEKGAGAKWRQAPQLLAALKRFKIPLKESFSGSQNAVSRLYALGSVSDVLRKPITPGLTRAINALPFRPADKVLPSALLTRDDLGKRNAFKYLFRGHSLGTGAGSSGTPGGALATPYLQDASFYGRAGLAGGNSAVTAFKASPRNVFFREGEAERRKALKIMGRTIADNRGNTPTAFYETPLRSDNLPLGDYFARNYGDEVARIPKDRKWSAILKTLASIPIGKQAAAEEWRRQAASRDWSGELSTANDYLARPGRDGKPLFGTDLTGQHFVNAASNTLANTGIHVPVPFALSVGQLETSLGRRLKSKNNTFNIGNFDDGRTRDFATPQAGVNAFSDLMANDYLKQHAGDVDALLNAGFRNHAGNNYASAADYAEKVRKQRAYITNGAWRTTSPAAPTPQTQQPATAPSVSDRTYYTVQPGETLGRIAKRLGVTVNYLLQYNPTITDPNRIRAGQNIVVPTP